VRTPDQRKISYALDLDQHVELGALAKMGSAATPQTAIGIVADKEKEKV
jgi:hypothetical protein